jgi:hypothetical protein
MNGGEEDTKNDGLNYMIQVIDQMHHMGGLWYQYVE